MHDRPVCLLVNPAAGGGKAARLAPGVEQALRGHGLSVRREDTRDLVHARELALAASGAGETVRRAQRRRSAWARWPTPCAACQTQCSASCRAGAATTSRACSACPTTRSPLARRLPTACTARSTSASCSTPPETADGRSYVGIASAGFDSDANRIANEAPAWLGGQVYAYGALRALLSWRPARFEIELDPPGERRSFVGYSVRRRQLPRLRRRHEPRA